MGSAENVVLSDGIAIYKRSTGHSIFTLAVCALFLAVGLYLFHDGGMIGYIICGTFILFGFAGTVFSLQYMIVRIYVGPEGLQRRPLLFGGYTIDWDEIELWTTEFLSFSEAEAGQFFDMKGNVSRGLTSHARCVGICLKNGKKPINIFDTDVSTPGYKQFVEQMEYYAGKKEKR